jgi:hypothetical protein
MVTQAPADLRGPVAVVVTSRRPGADPYSAKIAARILETAKREGVPNVLDDAAASKELKEAGYSDPRTCEGAPSCTIKLAVILGAKAVVIGVDVGKVAKSLAIHLEAVTADGEQSLFSVDLLAPADAWQDKALVDITKFVRKVKEALKPAAPVAELKEPPKETPKAVEPVKPAEPPKVVEAPKASDAPKEVALAPKPKADGDVMETFEAPEKGPKVLPWVLTGGAVVAAGAGAALAVLGSGDKARYDASLVTLPGGGQGTTLSQADAQALAGSVNGKMTGAVVSAVVAVLLGGGAAWAFMRE